MIKKQILILFLLLSFFIIYCEESDEQIISQEPYINLVSTKGYGYIKLSWELFKIPDYEDLELKVFYEEGIATEIPVFGKTSYILDRNFLKDEFGNYKEITVWLTATIEKVQKVGGKSFKTGVEYIASNDVIEAPLDYPSLQSAHFGGGKLICQLVLDNPVLTRRFYGFAVGNKKIKRAYNPYGYYDLQVSRNNQSSSISVLFESIDKPASIQESRRSEISKIDQYSGKYDNQFFQLTELQTSEHQLEDNFALTTDFNNRDAEKSIAIAWNKIAGAEQYIIYRIPSQIYDNQYLNLSSNSNLLSSIPGNNDRLHFENNYHIYRADKKEKLKSRSIYSYWINAQNMHEDLGTSDIISIYYYNEMDNCFTIELEEDSLEIILNNYDEIKWQNQNTKRALDSKNYKKYVTDYTANSDTLSFKYYYIKINPYDYLISENDGYITIDEVIRVYLPSIYSSDSDLLALMKVINYNSASNEQGLLYNKILNGEQLRIPIPLMKTESKE